MIIKTLYLESSMDKVKDIRELLTLNKAIYILERLQKSYDPQILKENPDLCKTIVTLFEDDFENI